MRSPGLIFSGGLGVCGLRLALSLSLSDGACVRHVLPDCHKQQRTNPDVDVESAETPKP